MLLFLYIWLYESDGFQKEAAARSLVQHLGERYVRTEYLNFTDRADGRYYPSSNFNKQAVACQVGYVALDCRVTTPYWEMLDRAVCHSPITGAYIAAEPYSWTIAESSIDMLNDPARDDADANMNKKG